MPAALIFSCEKFFQIRVQLIINIRNYLFNEISY